ncbi:MAG TPA: asparagine synthase-related protein [Nitriliruptorales bacterium]|nr:asparagine synthase-related protein [Nitriliruptorales bacterium]
MKCFVALSSDGRGRGPELAVVRDAVARLAGSATTVVDRPDGGRVIVGGLQPVAPVEGGGRFCVLLSRTVQTLAGTNLDGASLAARLGAGDSQLLAEMAPPFAACWRSEPDGPVLAATDRYGLRHLYVVQRPGWAAASSSSLLLAALLGEGIDQEALAARALVGSFLGTQTPFRGVSKLAAGTFARLAGGRVECRAYVSDPSLEPFPDRGTAVAAGKEAVTTAVRSCLRAHPRPVIELSGGLDSRLVLAAVPPDARRELHAVTIGTVDSDDLRVARSIAASDGIEHQFVDLTALGELSPEQALATVWYASRRRDHSGNAVALAVLDWVESHIEQRARLTGQNGEFARGFYYAGQRASARTSAGAVRSLAGWRLFSNDRVDPAIFAPGYLDDARATTVRVLQRIFAELGTEWLAATDEYYLQQRMQRWVGIQYSAACLDRPLQSPFFHAVYVEWARRCSPAMKRGSRIFCQVMQQVDPALAALPLDNGVRPTAVGRGGPAVRVAAGRRTASKAIAKVRQRLRGDDKPPVGGPVLAGLVAQAWSRQDDPLSRVASLEFVDAATVRAIARGQRAANPASIGFLLDLDGMLRTADVGPGMGQLTPVDPTASRVASARPIHPPEGAARTAR